MGNSGQYSKVPYKNESAFALKDIRNKYTRISTSDIVMFAPIYYPIAILEMNLDEMTFEDFESVQLAVLRFISLGQTEYEIIADLMGLSPNYVYKIMRLLKGYGHIDDNGITPLGQQSLMQEKKIVKSQVWQKFQVDALNGCLIKIDRVVSENMLTNKGQTNITVAHLDYLDGITVESINDQLMKQNYTDFIRQKTGILNTNVLAINDVRCLEVKYARCYLLKVRGSSEPIVFAKRYDAKKKEMRERFSWQPFSIESEGIRQRYNFEKEIPVSNQLEKQYVNNVFRMIVERSEKVDMEKAVPNALKKIYPFENKGITNGGYSDNNLPIVNVTEYALQKYCSWVPDFMLQLQQDGECLLTNEYLYGKVISIRSNSSRLLEVSKLLNAKVVSNDKAKVFGILKDNLMDFKVDDKTLLVDEMETVLRRI